MHVGKLNARQTPKQAAAVLGTLAILFSKHRAVITYEQGKAAKVPADLPVRQPGYIQDPSERLAGFRVFFVGVARDAAAALAYA